MPGRDSAMNPQHPVFQPVQHHDDASLSRLRCDSQSASFYADLSRYICKFYLAHETVSLVDIGPRTGMGLALLRLLHHPLAYTRLKFDPVVGVDVDPTFEQIAQAEFGDIIPRTSDGFALADGSFDLVTCSHVLQDVADPQGLVAKLRRVARRGLFVACPIAQGDGGPEGSSTISESFFRDQGFDDLEIYESQHWHGGLCYLAYIRCD